MSDPAGALWHGIATAALVVAVYMPALALHRRTRYFPLCHPLALGSLVLAGLVALLYPDYQTFRAGAAPFFWLLGPATVALALPLHHELPRLRARVGALSAGIVAGAVLAPALAVGLAALAGGREILSGVAIKSATTPIALGIADEIGARPELVAGVVIFTGVAGALLGPPLARRVGVTDERALGLALGINAHGVGTAAAFEASPRRGAWAGLGMGLTGVLTAVFLPLILGLAGMT